MPDRIIRGAILTSDSVNSLSWPGEIFFRRLMSVVDDFGRFDGRASILRAALYPLKLSSVSEPDVVKWMDECSSASLVRAYVVEGKNYIEILKFDQRLRAKTSKWPSPDPCCQVTTSDNIRPPPAAECGSRVDSDSDSDSVSYSRPGIGDARGKGSAFPSLEQVKQKAKFIGVPEPDAIQFWNHFEASGWIDKNGHTIIRWEAKLVTWKVTNQQVGSREVRQPSVLDLRTILEAKDYKAAELKKNYCSEAALGETWTDDGKFTAWKILRKEIRGLRDKISKMA